MEFPHVMVLFDDENREITEPLYQNRDKYKKVYDFDLNMDGGHVEGYFIDNVSEVLGKFEKLLDKERLIKKYGKQDNFAFAVGDNVDFVPLNRAEVFLPPLNFCRRYFFIVGGGADLAQPRNHPDGVAALL